MPLFKFKISDKDGRKEEMLVEGTSEKDAARRLQNRGLIPIELLGYSDAVGGGGLAGRWRQRFDVVDFTDRLAPLLEADIPLERALAIVEETSETPVEKELVGGLRRGLHEGRKLSQLIRDRGRLFPRMYAGIVEAGEESGALGQVLGELRDYLAMTREMRQYVVSSSIYPGILVCFSVLVNLLLLGLVVPKFGRIIYGMGKEPRLATRLLLQASFVVQNYWWAILIGALAAVAIFSYVLRQPRTREVWDSLVLRLPLLRRIVLLSNIGRQVRTMAILMKSGVHLLDTVSISASVLQNEKLRRAISGLAGDLRRGERLSVALGRSEYIPPLVIRMLAVGEETGDTESMLARVADRYDNELRRLVKRALAWFEPMVILVLGGMVGSIVLVLFMAIMDMQSAF